MCFKTIARWFTGSDGRRYMDVRPGWLNPGVIAHEQAYLPLINTDATIKNLYRINGYGLTNTVEGHAELYRYLDKEMPDMLKKYCKGLLA